MGMTSRDSHFRHANGVCLKLAVVRATQSLQLTGQAANVVWFALPPPSIKASPYPQAEQSAFAEDPMLYPLSHICSISRNHRSDAIQSPRTENPSRMYFCCSGKSRPWEVVFAIIED